MAYVIKAVNFIDLFASARGLLTLPIVAITYLFWRLYIDWMKLSDAISLVMIDILRFVLGDAKLEKNRHLVSIGENLSYYGVLWNKFTLKKEVNGLWIADKGMEIPPYESQKWKDIIVMYWIHGGGFCTGSSKTMVQAHVEVIQKFNSKSKRLKLVYFAVEYPLAPEVQLAEIQDKCFKEFKWLIQTVGPGKVVIGGDSAGGNLALCLLRDLSLSNLQIPKLCATLLISPLVDLSLSSCSENELILLSMSTDFLNVEMLKVWINCALYQSLEPAAVLNKDPKYSPLFANHIDLPNPLIIYSDGEVLAHGIEKWIQKFKKNSSITVLNEPGMPHDYVLFGSAMSQSSSIGFKSNFGLDLISNHILKSVATS